jgi:hypothetical protein
MLSFGQKEEGSPEAMAKRFEPSAAKPIRRRPDPNLNALNHQLSTSSENPVRGSPQGDGLRTI